MWAIANCRTDVLGGHVDVCPQCGDEKPSYNSCRNRHCPKCQSLQQALWLDKRKERILPTHYFHVVFTLPEELRQLCRYNPRALYDLLFASAAETLADFGRRELSAQLGVTMVLHTWTRDLKLHPHIHCVATGGGLDLDGNRWVATRPDFLFPVKPMGRCFRGKFLDGLRQLNAAGKIVLNGALDGEKQLRHLIHSLYQKDWVVYSKPPFGGSQQVFAYLGRYTHRVAISNARLVHVGPNEVRFRTRDGNHASLTPEKFIGRFLLHVLPHGFVKCRHYGLWASGNVKTRLEIARACLTSTAKPESEPASPSHAPRIALPLDWRGLLTRLTGRDPRLCPSCGAIRLRLPLPTTVPPNTS
jgi:hypothetical protein